MTNSLAPPHPADCICEWCIAHKRARRARIKTQLLSHALAPPPPKPLKPKWRRPHRKCEDCGKEVMVRKDGQNILHRNGIGMNDYCPGSGTYTDFREWLHTKGER